ARVLAADPAGEVDERASVDVGDAGAVGVGDDELRRRDAGAHEARALGEDAVVCGDGGGGGHRGSMTQSAANFTSLPSQCEVILRSLLAIARRESVMTAAFRRQRGCGWPYCARPILVP